MPSILSVALPESKCARSIGPKKQLRRRPGDTQVWALSIFSNSGDDDGPSLRQLLEDVTSVWTAPGLRIYMGHSPTTVVEEVSL